MSIGVIGLLKKGPIVADGRLECEIVDRLNLDKSPRTYQQVEQKLKRMERKGVLEISSSGNVMRSATLVPKSPSMPDVRAEEEEDEELEELERVEQAKESPTYTKEVDDETREEILMNDTVQDNDDPVWTQLSLALLALQSAADEYGVIKGASAQIIADELKVKISKANTLNGKLAKLGLRQTSGSRKSRIHQINMTTKEVTRQMVETLAKPSQETLVEPEANVVDVPKRDDTASPAPGEKTPLELMADIIEALEKDNIDLREQLRKEEERYEKSAAESAKVVRGLTESVTRATEKIREQQQLIAALQAPPSDRVKELIARHLPSTDK